MTGHYADKTRGPYRTADQRDAEEREERVDTEASRWFKDATKPQLKAYRDRVEYIRAWYGAPRWERDRDEALAKYKADTAAASTLYRRTFDELMETGEVSEELADAWGELEKAPALIIVGDHTPEIARVA